MERSRRWFLRASAFWSSAALACRGGAPAPPADPPSIGTPASAYGSRSPLERAGRDFDRNTRVPLEEAASRTPLHDTYGIITPSSPYATTLWDYIRRAMPFDHPGTLTADEIYGATAYVLFLNGLVSEQQELTRRRCPG